MNGSEDTSYIVEMTRLIATHGVFALVVIFIFYLRWRAVRNLKNAKNEDERKHFTKVHTAYVIALFVMVAITSVVWIYATFFHKRQTIVTGIVKELTHVPNKLTQEINPVLDLKFLTKKTTTNLEEGIFKLDWGLFSHHKLSRIVFEFQHYYTIVKPVERGRSPTQDKNPKVVRRVMKKHPILDLERIRYSTTSEIQMFYEPDSVDRIENIGQFFVRDSKGIKMYLDWEEDLPILTEKTGSVIRLFKSSLFSSTSLYAQDFRSVSIFKEDGSYGPKIGHQLRLKLGSQDLVEQAEGKLILTENGKKSARFILDSLDDFNETEVDSVILVYNLSEAVKTIKDLIAEFPPQGHLKLALKFYNLIDYKAAAYHFDRVENESVDDNTIYFYRAFTYYKLARYQQAIKDYNNFLDRAKNSYSQAVARTNLGNAFQLAGRFGEAIDEYRKAGQIFPKYPDSFFNYARLYLDRKEKLDEALKLIEKALRLAPDDGQFLDLKGMILQEMQDFDEATTYYKKAIKAKYPPSSNNLAYLYALTNANLDTALELVNYSIKIDPQIPAFWDTKGLILYKLKRYPEAVALLQRANDALPDIAEVKAHLDSAKSALTRSEMTVRK